MSFFESTQSHVENFGNLGVLFLNPREVAPFPRWSEEEMYVKTWHQHFDNFALYQKTMLLAPPSHGTTCFGVSHSLNKFRWAPVQMRVSTQYVSVLCLFSKCFGFDKNCPPSLQGRDVTLTLTSVPPIPVARVQRASTMWMVFAVYAPRAPITPAASRRWTSAWAIPASTGTVPGASAGE